MGIPDCNYVAMGESKEDVMKMENDHFMKSHPKEAKEMSPEELESQMGNNVVVSDDEDEKT